jgi:hypothetical protein
MTDYEHLKLCAARYVWRIRKQKVPGKSYNWEIWWRNKFKDDYKDYTRRMSEEREKEKAEKI